MISLKHILSEIRADKAELASEEELPAIQKTFIKRDLYDRYVKFFRGKKFLEQEVELLREFGTKPTKLPVPNKDTLCMWEWVDESGTTNFVLTLKKLSQNDKFAYCSFFMEKSIEQSIQEQNEPAKLEASPIAEPKNDEPTPESRSSIEKKPEKKEEPPKQEKPKDIRNVIKVSISQPFESIEGDLNVLKKFLIKLKIGKNKKF